MNKRLFVVTGAVLCAVITYASVLAVKNGTAHKSVAPNGAQQSAKSANRDVVSVTTNPAANSATQAGVGPTNPNVPEHVVYLFLFRHQNFLLKKAQEAESHGQDSSFFRQYYQREAKLDDRQAQILSEIATQCDLDVKAIEAEAKVIVDRVRADRAKAPNKADQAPPPPSPQLQALQQRLNNVVLQARNQLERALGPSSFGEFQTYVRDKVASQIKPKTPDTLRSVGRDSTQRQPQGKQPRNNE